MCMHIIAPVVLWPEVEKSEEAVGRSRASIAPGWPADQERDVGRRGNGESRGFSGFSGIGLPWLFVKS